MVHPSQQKASVRAGRREGWLVVTIALGLAVLLLLPYWLAYETVEAGTVFSGTIMNAEDSHTYFAKMLQGYDGAWLYRIPFTSEAHEAVFLGAFYVALGHLARIAGLSLETVWHVARIAADLFLFLTTYWFIAAYLHERRQRLTAYLLALLGSGMGWLLFLLNQPLWLGAPPVDFKMAEAHLFFTAMTFPHVALGTALLLVAARSIDRLLRETAAQAGRAIAVAAGANLLLVIAYPFLLYLVALTAALALGWRTLRRRTIPWRGALRIGATFVPVAPLAGYYAWVLQANPVFAAWDAQAGTPSPPWPHYLMAFGPMLLLAFFAWRKDQEREGRVILWCWLLAAALLLYMPLGPQRRFVQGLQVPLSILATAGLLGAVWPALRDSRFVRRLLRRPRYTEHGLRRLFLVLVLTFMALSNVYLFASNLFTIANAGAMASWEHLYPLFRPQEEMAAARWLRANSAPEDVVLGAYQTGNLVAARAGNVVVLGHWAETMDYEKKQAAVARFFGASTSDDWRRQLLARERVSIVWHGPQEAGLGAFDPRQADYLRPIARFESITLYKVVAP